MTTYADITACAMRNGTAPLGEFLIHLSKRVSRLDRDQMGFRIILNSL